MNDNADILIRFHEMNYEERLNATARQDHFRNSMFVPVAQQVNRAISRTVGSAQQAICRLDVLQGTALCPMPTS